MQTGKEGFWRSRSYLQPATLVRRRVRTLGHRKRDRGTRNWGGWRPAARGRRDRRPPPCGGDGYHELRQDIRRTERRAFSSRPKTQLQNMEIHPSEEKVRARKPTPPTAVCRRRGAEMKRKTNGHFFVRALRRGEPLRPLSPPRSPLAEVKKGSVLPAEGVGN